MKPQSFENWSHHQTRGMQNAFLGLFKGEKVTLSLKRRNNCMQIFGFISAFYSKWAEGQEAVITNGI